MQIIIFHTESDIKSMREDFTMQLKNTETSTWYARKDYKFYLTAE